MFWTRNYWLEHCEGYRVETTEGHRGFVEEIIGEPERSTLLVRWCRRDAGLTAVRIDRVREVRPEAEELLILDPAADDVGDSRAVRDGLLRR